MFHSYVESNKQTEPTSNIETDSQIESMQTALVVGGFRGGGEEIKQKRKKRKRELMDRDNSVLPAGGGRWRWKRVYGVKW